MRKKLFILLMLLSIVITGCAKKMDSEAPEFENKVTSYSKNDSASTGYLDEYESEYISAESADDSGGETGDILTSNQTDRKLIKKVNLNIETLEFDQFTSLLENKTIEYGGYLESSNLNANSYHYAGLRNATYTIRIPSEYLDQFVMMVGENANITNKSISTEDATLSYYDTESRKKALEVQQERILAMLEQCETVEDMITLEARLSDITYQLEAKNVVLRNYDNLVEFSTIHIQLNEVERETKATPATMSQKMARGFSNSLYHIKDMGESFLIFVVVNSLYIIFWGALIFIAIIIIKKKVLIKHTKQNTSKIQTLSENDDDKQSDEQNTSIKK